MSDTVGSLVKAEDIRPVLAEVASECDENRLRALLAELVRIAAPVTLDEKRERMVMRFMPKDPKKLATLEKHVRDRVKEFRKQKPEVVEVDSVILSGRNKFGVCPLPRTLNEPERMESKYRICEFVDEKDGRHIAQAVTLTVWADWKCQEAVVWNKAMVARACANNKPRELNFSTRMQTEVQTRAVLMWLQLHGQFFWDESLKSFNTSLYFDREKKILRRIKSEEFQSWLQNHAEINSTRSDFDFLMSEVDAIAFNPEVARSCRPRALFNRKEIAGSTYIYISNGDSWMMKVGADKAGRNIQMVPNGTDGVVFLNGSTLAPWEFDETSEGEDPFVDTPPFSTANYMSKHGAMIARMWILSIAACQPSFPAIVFTGKARSGKTRFAKAVCELFGTKHRSASIDPGTAGKKDFWTIVDADGVVNFDNVDTKIDWFSDAMQQACTDGSFESRTLFKDKEITTLQSRARIILTSNNPMFAAESGLSDRLQIVRMLPLNGKNGKEVADSGITVAIAANRNKALTWYARTISKALADTDPVEKNVNFRHPDFADFAMRCSRALGMYDESVLALKSAEFDKAFLTVQTNSTVNYIYEALRYFFTKKSELLEDKVWVGRSGDMMKLIMECHPQLVGEDGRANRLCPSDVSIGKMLSRYWEQLAVLFDVEAPKNTAGEGTKYCFKGFSAAYLNCISDDGEEMPKNESEENEDFNDIF